MTRDEMEEIAYKLTAMSDELHSVYPHNLQDRILMGADQTRLWRLCRKVSEDLRLHAALLHLLSKGLPQKEV